MHLTIKTLAGLEEVLAAELQALGAQAIVPLTRAVAAEADLRVLYRANLELRTALRVLVSISEFEAHHEADLYRAVRHVDWSRYLGPDQTLAVDVVTQSEVLHHSHFLALKTKDAIVDQFRDRYGRRPSVDTRRPHLRVHVHLNADGQGALSLDSSGDGLHRRGYRLGTGEAPLNEVLAAGLIKLSGWPADVSFVDPFCGSGTLLIEAATLALGIPPGWGRSYFGFQRWPNFDAGLWDEILSQARRGFQRTGPLIIGGDIDARALRTASQNIEQANLSRHIRLTRKHFAELTPPPPPGWLVTNPPYDLRLPTEDVVGLYQEIGDTLKKQYQGYQAWIISAHLEALKHLGLRPSRKIALFNGQLPAKLHGYELYAGTKRQGLT